MEEVFNELIDTISKLKYVQTDESLDLIVHVQVTYTLSSIFSRKVVSELPGACLQRILNCLFSNLVQDSSPVAQDLPNRSITMQALSNGIDELTCDRGRTNCLEAIFGFLKHLVDNLDDEVSVSEQPLNAQTDMKIELENGLVEFVSFGMRKLVLSLKMILYTFTSLSQHGDVGFLDIVRSESDLMWLFRERLGASLLKVILSHSENAVVVHLSLCIYSRLFYALGPCIPTLTESMIKFVYIRGLQEVSQMIRSKLLKTPSPPSAVENSSFSFDALEHLLDNICDLISDTHFLPSIYLSYDSNPCKQNLSEILMNLITDCGRLSYKLQEQTGMLDYLAMSSINCFHQLLTSMRSNLWAVRETCSEDQDDSMVIHNHLTHTKSIKEALAIAVQKFCEKPTHCFSYLQEMEIMPSILTAESVASFLRNVPSLPKDKIGSFLGELGKDNNCKNISETVKFHERVLKAYVESFNLENLGILDCLRVFLSAFRLPGEAQQIDRILVAFADHCHIFCKESKLGILEHSDVLYLLTFSIIMLNTDRHNPHIRLDRKMTLEQFIKNNTFYGSDCHQTKALPRDLLEGIYVSIATCPLATEESAAAARFSREMWLDMTLQANSCRDRGVAFLFGWEQTEFETLLRDIDTHRSQPIANNNKNNSDNSGNSGNSDDNHNHQQQSETNINNNSDNININTNTNINSMISDDWKVTLDMHGFHCQFVSRHVISNTSTAQRCCTEALCRRVYCNLVVSLLDIFSHLRLLAAKDDQNQSRISASLVESEMESLRLCIQDTIHLCHSIREMDLIDSIVIALVDLCTSSEGGKSAVSTSLIAQIRQSSSGVDDFQGLVVTPQDLVNTINSSVYSRALLSMVFKLVHECRDSITKSWQVIWMLLGVMRDAGVLPSEMVLEAKGEDVLPEVVRSNFDHLICEYHRGIAASRSNKESLQDEKKESKSFFRSLSWSLFGGSEDNNNNNNNNNYNNNNNNNSNYNSNNSVENRDNLPAFAWDSARWDSGYEEVLEEVCEASSPSTSNRRKSISKHTQFNIKKYVSSLGLSELVSDSRFLPEECLKSLVLGLVKLVHGLAAVHEDRKESPSTAIMGCQHIRYANEVVLSKSLGISPAGKAWMENILADISIRNRERIHMLWPVLGFHYSFSVDDLKAPTYTIERRIVGIFRIANRIMNRSQSTSDVISMLLRVFVENIQELIEFYETESPDKPLEVWFSYQFAASLWHLLTSNVSTLPCLTLEQWQSLFDLIAVCSKMSEYASIRAFEIMAWILHEPRLVAEVPVFCVSAIQPLVRSRSAPVSVAIGAVKLLYHLHSRLEVLVKSDVPDNSETSDAPVLWESCWLPILRAIADGVSDSRPQVKMTSIYNLSNCLLDAHAQAVPVGLYINILSDVYIPALTVFVTRRIVIITETDNYYESECDVSDLDATEGKCFHSLAETLHRNIARVVCYPAFDKLWIHIINFFGEILGNSNIKDDQNRFTNYRSHFADLFCLFDQTGVFHDKPELLKITKESLDVKHGFQAHEEHTSHSSIES